MDCFTNHKHYNTTVQHLKYDNSTIQHCECCIKFKSIDLTDVKKRERIVFITWKKTHKPELKGMHGPLTFKMAKVGNKNVKVPPWTIGSLQGRKPKIENWRLSHPFTCRKEYATGRITGCQKGEKKHCKEKFFPLKLRADFPQYWKHWDLLLQISCKV